MPGKFGTYGVPNIDNIQNASTEQLWDEYLTMQKAIHDSMFGKNATDALNKVVDELERRNQTAIPNIFGAIQAKRHVYASVSRWMIKASVEPFGKEFKDKR